MPTGRVVSSSYWLLSKGWNSKTGLWIKLGLHDNAALPRRCLLLTEENTRMWLEEEKESNMYRVIFSWEEILLFEQKSNLICPTHWEKSELIFCFYYYYSLLGLN